MKVIRRFVQLNLMVAILLASVGFRVNLQDCSGKKEGNSHFLGDSGCCCEKTHKSAKSQDNSCNDLICLVQAGVVNTTQVQSGAEQSLKVLKAPIYYFDFSQNIRPAILETLPHFTLPPPVSGRYIGILHQTFII